jgi:hypothetical protein
MAKKDNEMEYEEAKEKILSFVKDNKEGELDVVANLTVWELFKIKIFIWLVININNIKLRINGKRGFTNEE